MGSGAFRRNLGNWLNALQIILCVVALLWGITLVNQALGYGLSLYGIKPREPEGLVGILFWVVLHGNMTHLLLNTTPLFFLGFFVALRGPLLFLKITALVWILAGLAVWLLGRPAIHLGASGLVFGYFGFLLAVAVYERSIFDLLVASIAIFYYGGMIFGVLPVGGFVSWESHLFGLCMGVLAARVYGKDWVQGPTRQNETLAG
jgi:membrane associated rhomboid family serine protease